MRCGGGTGAGLEVCLHTINGGLISQERLLTKGCCRALHPLQICFPFVHVKLNWFYFECMPHVFFLNLSNVFSPCVLLRSLGEIPDLVHSGTNLTNPLSRQQHFLLTTH